MSLFRSSMRTSLGLTVLVMGVLGMVLAIATSEAYRHLALENQRDAFVELAKLKADDIIEYVIQNAVDLGVTAQSSAKFKTAFHNKQQDVISTLLDEHFHRAFVTLGLIKLDKIYAIDNDFAIIAISKEGNPEFPTQELPCHALTTESLYRKGAQRLKPISQLCNINNRPYIATLTPIGGLRLEGYLMVIIDPIQNFATAEKGLGTPLRLSLPSGEQLTQSNVWPQLSGSNILLAEYLMHTESGEPYLKLSFATNNTNLLQKLSLTRNKIFAVAVVVMLLTALLALIIFKRTALVPLNTLASHLRRVQKDKSHLGEQVMIEGNTEISELANDFNSMSGELHALYKALENMAFTDTLTGMANRALFYNRLEQATLNAQRYNQKFAVLMMDLNRFKNVNDTLGHHVGDQILQEVGLRLQSILRKSDTVARLGGDEFAALLPAVDYEDGVVVVAEKIVDILNQPIAVEGHTLSIGVSIGMVHCPHDGENPNLLMRRADVAMYQAKRQSLGYAAYKEDMDNDSLFQLTMEAELRKALENQAFELHYQPKIDLARNRITGVEALIRWIHPKHGFVPPDQFIPVAETSGLIHPITDWVLNTALEQCAQWEAAGLNIGVSVNLSAYSLNDNTLMGMISRALENHQISKDRLTLELTESAIMSDASNALETLTQLDQMGIRLSVDDFGTGYSSLAYLKRLPVDEIKIDKSFVMDMVEDMNDAVIVRSTIDLAHNMGMSVVAEGIENQEIMDKLHELQCDQGQGFHMCRPCKIADLMQWLDESPWGLSQN